MFQRVAFDYSGSSVLITGGTSGIGQACAEAYLQAGANVHVTGRKSSLSDYDSAAALAGCRYSALDVSDRYALKALADSLDSLDVLIANAGGTLMNEWESDGFDQSIDIHLNSVFHLSSACKDLLAASEFEGGASIIGIASMTSYFGNVFTPAYGPAKAGIVQLMKTFSVGWGELGIRANAVAAGLVHSNLTSLSFEHMPEMVADTVKRQSIKREGYPADVAAAVLFLTCPAASWITGQTLPVDGGYTVGM